MNPKIQKIDAEIGKTKAKITEQQTRLRELERQKTELENADIVALVRGVKSTPEELAALLETLRGGALSSPAVQPAPERPVAQATGYSGQANQTEQEDDNEG